MRTFCIFISLLLSACVTGPAVRTDFDPTANFSSFRTYSWISSAVPRGMNPLMFQRVETLVGQSMARRGFTQTDAGDFAIAFTIVEDDRLEIDPYGTFEPWFRDYPGPYDRRSTTYPPIEIDQYTERRVVIDIYDTARRPLWHGSVIHGAVSDRVDYGQLRREIDALIAEFPPASPHPPIARAASANPHL